MCVVIIDVPEEILLDLHENKEDFTRYTKIMLALDLYQNRRVSLGYCADIADMSKEEFIQCLSLHGISIFSFESAEEFSEELKHA